jgi:hypothetical protein
MAELAERSPMDLVILRLRLLADLKRIQHEKKEVAQAINRGSLTYQLPSGDEVNAKNYLEALQILSRSPLASAAYGNGNRYASRRS